MKTLPPVYDTLLLWQPWWSVFSTWSCLVEVQAGLQSFRHLTAVLGELQSESTKGKGEPRFSNGRRKGQVELRTQKGSRYPRNLALSRKSQVRITCEMNNKTLQATRIVCVHCERNIKARFFIPRKLPRYGTQKRLKDDEKTHQWLDFPQNT